MGYSIFSETMADMTYQEIEKSAKNRSIVLFPIAVIEEHGPHMCLGTDAYLTYNFCRILKRRLYELKIEALIAPPYYWGINVVTNGFPGSFTVKPETMISILCDLLGCLKSWGFENIFLFNFHGDFKHSLTIIDVAKRAYEELGVGAYFIVPDHFLKRAGLPEKKPYLIVRQTKPVPPSEYFDLHAGGSETSLMIKNFPDLVNVDLAKTLKSSKTTLEGLKVWRHGGEMAKEVTPLGYCGDPSKIDMEEAKVFEEEMIEDVAKRIYDFLNKK